MKKKIFILLLAFGCSVFVSTAHAQPDTTKPIWYKNTPNSLNPSYSFKKINAFGRDLNSARENCLSTLTSNSGLQGGVVVVSNNKYTETISQVFNNGKLTEKINYNSETITDAKSAAVSLQIIIIDEYWEYTSNGYNLTVLYATSDINKTAQFDDFSTTTSYGASGLWRSAIVPGWGQLYKGSKAKGGVIFGGTVALVIGAMATDNMRTSYITKASQTYDVTAIKKYAAKADNMANMRNICIGGAVALYVYNLVDAIVAPGARRVVVKSRFAQRFSVQPNVNTEGAVGLMTNLNF